MYYCTTYIYTHYNIYILYYSYTIYKLCIYTLYIYYIYIPYIHTIYILYIYTLCIYIYIPYIHTIYICTHHLCCHHRNKGWTCNPFLHVGLKYFGSNTKSHKQTMAASESSGNLTFPQGEAPVVWASPWSASEKVQVQWKKKLSAWTGLEKLELELFFFPIHAWNNYGLWMFMVDISIVNGVYKPSYNWGGTNMIPSGKLT